MMNGETLRYKVISAHSYQNAIEAELWNHQIRKEWQAPCTVKRDIASPNHIVTDYAKYTHKQGKENVHSLNFSFSM